MPLTCETRTAQFLCRADGAAVDLFGNIYVSLSNGSGVYEYGPSGNGNIQPITGNTSALGPPATDGAGNVYAIDGTLTSTLGVWQAGTFGLNAPGRTVTAQGAFTLGDIGVDPAGDAYSAGGVIYEQIDHGYVPFPLGVLYAAAGSSTFSQLPVGTNWQAIAVPLQSASQPAAGEARRAAPRSAAPAPASTTPAIPNGAHPK